MTWMETNRRYKFQMIFEFDMNILIDRVTSGLISEYNEMIRSPMST